MELALALMQLWLFKTRDYLTHWPSALSCYNGVGKVGGGWIRSHDSEGFRILSLQDRVAGSVLYLGVHGHFSGEGSLLWSYSRKWSMASPMLTTPELGP